VIPRAYAVEARLKRALASLRYFPQCQTSHRRPFAELAGRAMMDALLFGLIVGVLVLGVDLGALVGWLRKRWR